LHGTHQTGLDPRSAAARLRGDLGKGSDAGFQRCQGAAEKGVLFFRKAGADVADIVEMPVAIVKAQDHALDQRRTLRDKPADDTIRLLHVAHFDPVGRTDSGEIWAFQVLADDPLQVSCRRGLKIRLASADDALAEEDPLARANDGLQLLEPSGERLVKQGLAVS